MRNCVPFLVLALAPYASAEPLPRFLNSNDSMQTLPTPNLPVDAYRPPAPALELPKPAAAQPRPLEMGTRLTIRKLQIEGVRSTRCRSWVRYSSRYWAMKSPWPS